VLFIFIGSMALVSLVPAVFIELQMIERKKHKAQKAAKRLRKEREAHVELLHHVFDMSDIDGHGYVTVSQLEDVLEELDRPGANNGRRSSTIQKDELKDFRLCLFEMWAEKYHEMGDRDAKISKSEFTAGILNVWGNTDLKAIWRGVTTFRWQQAIKDRGTVTEHFHHQEERQGTVQTSALRKLTRKISTATGERIMQQGGKRSSVSLANTRLSRMGHAESTEASDLHFGSRSSLVSYQPSLNVDDPVAKLRDDILDAFKEQGEAQAAAQSQFFAELRLLTEKVDELEKGLTAWKNLSTDLKEERALIESVQKMYDEHFRRCAEQIEETVKQGNQINELNEVCRSGFHRLQDLVSSTMESRSVRVQASTSFTSSTTNQSFSLVTGQTPARSPSTLHYQGTSASPSPAEDQLLVTRNPFQTKDVSTSSTSCTRRSFSPETRNDSTPVSSSPIDDGGLKPQTRPVQRNPSPITTCSSTSMFCRPKSQLCPTTPAPHAKMQSLDPN
jgi:hypothetical protein